LGYMSDSQGEWIAIPYIQDGKLWNFKYRRFAGGDKQFKRMQGCATILFNIDNLDYSKNGILAVEGEMDAMAAWQMGVTNVIGMTAGAGTFKPEWVKVFSQFKTTYLCLDSDEKGQMGAKKIADKIGLKKTKNILLPVKDSNEYLMNQAYTPQQYLALVGSAKQFETTHVGTIADIVHKLDNWFDGVDNGIQGLATGFPQIDALTKGLKAGDLVILSGDSGIGKTTLANNIINNLVQLDNPVFYFSLEGQLEYYIARMIGAELGLAYTQLRDNAEDWINIKKHVASLPLFYYNGPQGGLSLEQVKELIPTVVNLYDIKCLVIDNLQKMMRGSDTQYYQRLAETVSVLKDIAVDCKIPIVLIAHITKMNEDKQVITMHDVKGSSTIYQDSDMFLILQKIKQKMFLSIDKNRMGQGGVHVEMLVNKDIGKFEEAGSAPVNTEDVGKAPRTHL